MSKHITKYYRIEEEAKMVKITACKKQKRIHDGMLRILSLLRKTTDCLSCCTDEYSLIRDLNSFLILGKKPVKKHHL